MSDQSAAGLHEASYGVVVLAGGLAEQARRPAHGATIVATGD